MTWGWVIDAIFLFLGELFNVLYIELTINNLQSIYESGVTLNSIPVSQTRLKTSPILKCNSEQFQLK